MQLRSTHCLAPIFLLALFMSGGAAQQASDKGAGAPKGGADAEAATKLKKRLLETAQKVYEIEVQRLNTGANAPFDVERLSRWSHRWLKAQLDLAASKDERQAAYKGHLQRMGELAARAAAFVKAGVVPVTDAAAAEYFRIQAELLLEQARAK